MVNETFCIIIANTKDYILFSVPSALGQLRLVPVSLVKFLIEVTALIL